MLFLNQSQPTFPVKDKLINISGFVGQQFLFATTQLCHCSMKATVDNM